MSASRIASWGRTGTARGDSIASWGRGATDALGDSIRIIKALIGQFAIAISLRGEFK